MLSVAMLSSSSTIPSRVFFSSSSSSSSLYNFRNTKKNTINITNASLSPSSLISPQQHNLRLFSPINPITIKRSISSFGPVCHVGPVYSPHNLQWACTVASVVLMLVKGTAVQKSLLVPFFALQAPTSIVSWIKVIGRDTRIWLKRKWMNESGNPSYDGVYLVDGYSHANLNKSEYGAWAAFLALLVRLFYFIPGELELPLAAMLLVIVAPHQLITQRGTQAGVIISLALAGYAAFQHFSRLGNFQSAFDQGSVVATLAVISIIVVPGLLLI